MLVPARSYAGAAEVPRRPRHLREARRGRGRRSPPQLGRRAISSARSRRCDATAFRYACVYREYLTDDARLVLANLRDAVRRGARGAEPRAGDRDPARSGPRGGRRRALRRERPRAPRARALRRQCRRPVGRSACAVSRMPHAPPRLHLSKGVHVGDSGVAAAAAADRDPRHRATSARSSRSRAATSSTSAPPTPATRRGADPEPPVTRDDVEYLLEPMPALLRHRTDSPLRIASRPGRAAAADRGAGQGAGRVVAARRDRLIGRAASSRSRAASSPAIARWAPTCVERVAEVLGARARTPHGTRTAPLPGGDFDGDLDALARALERESDIDGDGARLARLYGTEAEP